MYPKKKSDQSSSGLSFLFLFLNYIVVRSTNRPRMVEMAYIFAPPTLTRWGHIMYQLKERRRWVVRKYLLRKSDKDNRSVDFVTWSTAEQKRLAKVPDRTDTSGVELGTDESVSRPPKVRYKC
jgi:hypothetical protein